MVRIDLISGPAPKWRKFLSEFKEGDSVTFMVTDFSVLETIRSSAYQVNIRRRVEPFRLKVSGRPSESPITVTIMTVSKDKTKE